MPNKKITELSANTSPSYSDVLPIVNDNITKNITLSGLTDFLSTTSLKFPEAPIDGNQYARQDGDWVVIESQLNEITFSAGFTIDTDEVTMLSGWTWTIDGSGYTNSSDVIITIPAASVDYRRIDLIVADTSNSFYLVQGIESNDIPVAPNLPADTLQATFITVNGDVIDVTPVEGNFVTLDTAQTIVGAKLFTQDIFINNMRVGIGMGNLDTNVVFGANAFTGNTIGTFNVGIGQNSLQKNIIGNNNTAIGAFTLYNSTGSSFNVAIGTSALQNSTTGDQNIAIGASSLRNNTTGLRNIGIGASSLINNIVGISNTAIGNQALFRSIGDFNIGIGRNAGAALVSGNKNITITNDATSSTNGLKTGDNNIIIGSSNTGLLTGSSNVFIGTVTGLSPTLSNNIILADGDGNQRLKVNESGVVNIVSTPTTNTSNTRILSRNSSTGNLEIVPVSAITSGITTPNLQQVTNVSNSTTEGIYIDNPIGNGFLGTKYVGDVPRYLFTGFGDGTVYPGTYSFLIQADLEEWITISSTDGTSSTHFSNTPLQARISKNIGSTAYTLNVDENGIGIQTNGSLGYLKTDNLAFPRTYQLPDNHGTIALLSDLSNINLQSVIEGGNVAEFNSGSTTTRLPNESDTNFTISATNLVSGNNENYTVFAAPNNFITQVGEYNDNNPSYGDRTFRMNDSIIELKNYKYFLPEDEDLTSGFINIYDDNVVMSSNNYTAETNSNIALNPTNISMGISNASDSNGMLLTVDSALFSKIIQSPQGLFVNNPYGSSQIATPYLGGSPQLRFFTSGDGTEFPSEYNMTLNMNIEEYFNLQAFDGAGNGTSMALSPNGSTIFHSGIGSLITNLYLNDNGFGLQTSALTGYFKSDNLSSDRTYQLPDVDGTILTTAGTTSGNPVTGDVELLVNRIYSDDGIGTGSVYYLPGTINVEAYNDDDSTYAAITVANNGSVTVNTTISGNPSNGLTGQYDYTSNITDLDYTQKKYVDSLKPYRVYTALLTQTGTTAPIATVLENNLGETIIFEYSEPGNYTITNQDLFVESKTFILIGREGFAGTLAPVVSYSFNLPDDGFYNALQITSSNQGLILSTFDNLIKDVSIEIRVYN